MNWNNKAFQILNLNTTETNILNVLDIPKNVQDIAKESGVSRTGINHVLKKLIRNGLVHSRPSGKRKVYVSISLEQLLLKFKDAMDNLEIRKVEKKGSRVKVSHEDEFIIHVGTKEILPAYERIASMNKGERIRAIQHHRSWKELIEKISSKKLIEFNQTIIKNNIILDGMLNESAYSSYWNEIKSNPAKHKDAVKSLEGRMADYTVFPDKSFDYDAEIWIFKTTTLIINWHEEVAIEITNANMTGFLKDMFESVKMLGRKIDHAQAMRELEEKMK